jgi:hypothetical protein
MVLPKNTAMIGAFMMEGLRDLERAKGITYDDIYNAWGGGVAEMVAYMTSFAPHLEEHFDKRFDPDIGFPGVFDYEVSAPFGMWFGERVYNNAIEGIPRADECLAKCDELMDAFFNQGESA